MTEVCVSTSGKRPVTIGWVLFNYLECINMFILLIFLCFSVKLNGIMDNFT